MIRRSIVISFLGVYQVAGRSPAPVHMAGGNGMPGVTPACYDRLVNTRRWSDMAAEEYCYLTTAGRVTGGAHTIEIWFAAVGDTAYMLAGGGRDADWVRNLRANPHVSLRIADVTYPATARIVTEPDEAATARGLLYDKYNPGSNGDLATWRDSALPVAIDREDAK